MCKLTAVGGSVKGRCYQCVVQTGSPDSVPAGGENLCGSPQLLGIFLENTCPKDVLRGRGVRGVMKNCFFVRHVTSSRIGSRSPPEGIPGRFTARNLSPVHESGGRSQPRKTLLIEEGIIWDDAPEESGAKKL